MGSEWRNWAGDQRCRPAAIERPRSLQDLVEIVARAGVSGQAVRASGSGHSFTDIALTDGVMVRLDSLTRVLDVDRGSGLARVEGGVVLGDLNRRLDELGLAFENLGDIDRQTLAGSISTGTHGTGAGFQSISAQVAALEVVRADGSVVEVTEESDGDALRAARLGLGALGIVYSVTVRTVPSYTLDRVDRPRPLAETLDGLEDLIDGNDHFEFYVFPHTEVALCRETRRTDEAPEPANRAAEYLREVVLENWVGAAFSRAARHLPSQVPRLSRFASRNLGDARKKDRWFKVFASERRIRFTEMEYGIPRRHAREAVERVLELAGRPKLQVAWPIEVRFVAPDDNFLSASCEQETCYIAVHQDSRLDWEPYFRGVEAIAAEYGGRPHWGKRHFQTAETLAPRYPGWDAFQRVRARLDPGGTFRNPYTDRVLGPVRA